MISKTSNTTSIRYYNLPVSRSRQQRKRGTPALVDKFLDPAQQ